VEFAHLATQLRAEVVGDTLLRGWYGNPRRADSVRVLIRRRARIARTATGPDIAGSWIVPVETAKGEHAWRLVVEQNTGATSATLLRVDGDAGAHVGHFVDSTFILDHFDGTRPGRLELIPQPDQSLVVVQRGPRGNARRYVAWRESEAAARGLPRPADVATHTTVRDSTVPFVFDFPDVNGERVRNSDARFAGKVVLVNVTGSWCPNCHDEAPYLSDLYARYKAQGFEVVALDFEEAEELVSRTRLRAFLARYRIAYPYLVAGEPREVLSRLPQAVNLNTWPATFFLGRDGRVRAVRTGFAARASGAFHEALRRDYEGLIEQLLRESAPASR
jgi:thiol-disulfide isomerase/thioredoxin